MPIDNNTRIRSNDVGGGDLGRALGNLAGTLFDAFRSERSDSTDRSTNEVLTGAVDALTRALGGSGLAMNPAELAQLKRAVRNADFDRDKVDVIRTAAPHAFFTAAQVKELVNELDFSSGKLDALRALSDKIVDPQNNYVIFDAFDFSNDKAKARQILAGS